MSILTVMSFLEKSMSPLYHGGRLAPYQPRGTEVVVLDLAIDIGIVWRSLSRRSANRQRGYGAFKERGHQVRTQFQTVVSPTSVPAG
jgi:hypothetical protein